MVGTSYGRVDHAATPHRNLARLAELLNRGGFAVTADSSELNVDHSARAQLHRCCRVPHIANRFIETDRRRELLLQMGMEVDIVSVGRLLHQKT
jgi:hypothetical protein